jgi:hypothetical protein
MFGSERGRLLKALLLTSKVFLWHLCSAAFPGLVWGLGSGLCHSYRGKSESFFLAWSWSQESHPVNLSGVWECVTWSLS